MITIKQNDNGIGLKATLSNQAGNVDLTNANVLFLFSEFEIKPQVTNATEGELLVTFEQIHTEKTGIFNAEFEVQFEDGRIETFPSDDYVKIYIMQDLGGR